MIRRALCAVLCAWAIVSAAGCSDGKNEQADAKKDDAGGKPSVEPTEVKKADAKGKAAAEAKVENDEATDQAMTNIRLIAMACFNHSRRNRDRDGVQILPKDLREIAGGFPNFDAMLISPEGGRFEYYGAGRDVAETMGKEPLGAFPVGRDGLRIVVYCNGSAGRIPEAEFRILMRKDSKGGERKGERKAS